jgi:uncharacterized membrane protein YbhN (UPF0104 family)
MFGDKTRKYQMFVSLLFLVLLIYLLSKLRVETIYEEIVEINKQFLVLGVLSLTLAAIVKVFRFALVSRSRNHPISIAEASLIQMVGISMATLTPARVGEGSKVVLLNKYSGVPMTTSIGIVVFERLFDMLVLGSGAFLFSLHLLGGRTTVLFGIFLTSLFALFILFLKYFNSFKKLIPEKYKKYFTDVKSKNSPKLIFIVLFLTILTWSLEAGLPWFLGLSMGVSLSFLKVFGVICISTIAVIISIFPAGLGTVDLSFLLLFSLIGAPVETAVSILLIYRFFGIVLPFVFSLIIVNVLGLSLKEVKRELKD